MKVLKIAAAFVLAAALCFGIYFVQNEPNVSFPFVPESKVSENAEPSVQNAPETETEEKPDVIEEKDEAQTKPKEEEPQKLNPQCTISVRCDTVLANISKLDRNKVDIIPENGMILPETTVEISGNETAFDVLKRVLKDKKIHIEFSKTPGTGSVYIEGIGNLYEFDCGELSGWMFKLNGEFPKKACSEFVLKDKDKAEFIYTCDLGADIGGNGASGGA